MVKGSDLVQEKKYRQKSHNFGYVRRLEFWLQNILNHWQCMTFACPSHQSQSRQCAPTRCPGHILRCTGEFQQEELCITSGCPHYFVLFQYTSAEPSNMFSIHEPIIAAFLSCSLLSIISIVECVKYCPLNPRYQLSAVTLGIRVEMVEMWMTYQLQTV